MGGILFLLILASVFKSNLLLQPSNNNQKNAITLDNINLLQMLGQKSNSTVNKNSDTDTVPCTCAVFLSGQFQRGSTEQPKGLPALMHEQEINYPCTLAGNKQCINKCLDSIVKHLPNSGAILCGSIDRDCYKERAYLFYQNCAPLWINTNLSAGKEYCCKDGISFKCPLI